MDRFGLVATGSDSWLLLRTPRSGTASSSTELSLSVEQAIANLRKTSAHPELWFFQSVGEPHMVPIIAEDYYVACKKYLLQIEEREIGREDLTLF
ncbi:MAG TPA: hypothetical protein VFH43_05875 [Candidatus Kapabacteria bacterium]|jgi:hypothetical protein|nr:hypothetical protein [Candidatus Kapabacteria bacterium]